MAEFPALENIKISESSDVGAYLRLPDVRLNSESPVATSMYVLWRIIDSVEEFRPISAAIRKLPEGIVPVMLEIPCLIDFFLSKKQLQRALQTRNLLMNKNKTGSNEDVQFNQYSCVAPHILQDLSFVYLNSKALASTDIPYFMALSSASSCTLSQFISNHVRLEGE